MPVTQRKWTTPFPAFHSIRQAHKVAGHNAPWTLSALAILTGLASLLVLSGGAVWLVSDDQAIEWLASGWYTGNPGSDLVFVDKLLGLPLSWLYSLEPALPWYGALLLAMNLLASWSVSFLCINFWLRVAWLCSVPPLFSFIALRPSFTTSALFAGTAGVVLITLFIIKSGKALGYIVPGCVLLLAACSLRLEAALLAILLTAPMLLYGAMHLRPYITQVRLIIAFTVSFITIGFALGAREVLRCIGLSDSMCEAWRVFGEYNRIRGSFHGAPRMTSLAAIAPSHGWTEPSVQLFEDFAYADTEVFGLEKLQELDALVPQILVVQGGSPIQHILRQIEAITQTPYFWAFSIVAVLIPGLVLTKRFRFIGVGTLVIGLSWITVLSLVALIRLPQAVIYGTTFSFTAQAILLGFLAWRVPPSYAPVRAPRGRHNLDLGLTSLTALAIGLAILSGTWSSMTIARLVVEGRTAQLSGVTARHTLSDAFGAAPVFAVGSAAIPLMDSPYVSRDSHIGVGPLVGGWLVFSPAWDSRAQSLGFSDVYQDYLIYANNPLSFQQDRDADRPLFLGTANDARNTADALSSMTPWENTIVAVPTEVVFFDTWRVWKFIRSSGTLKSE